MSSRAQITIDPEMQRRAQAKAEELGISFAAYVRQLLSQDLRNPARKTHVSLVFDLVDEGPQTNIARDKDKMLGQAVQAEHSRKVSRRRRPNE